MSAILPAGLRAGLLHTVPALAGTFEAELTAREPGLELLHVADAWLLAETVREGLTDAVTQRVAQHVRSLAAAGARAILVTCSSIGDAVDAAARSMEIPVLRVDRPMAAQAVSLAGTGGRSPRISVLATLDATLEPTRRLIEREAATVGADVVVASSVIPGALAARQSGDQDLHDSLIRAAVTTASSAGGVVVLAQASMAGALAGLDLSQPVLTSPIGGMDSLIAALAAA